MKNKIISIVTLVSFLTAGISDLAVLPVKGEEALSIDTSAAVLKPFDRENFILPQDLGSVKDRHFIEGMLDGEKKIKIVHIQDAHCNYWAQIKISKILEYLDNEYGIGVINMEGGSGEYDLSIFKNIGDNGLRGKVTDRFLKEGALNAAEYYVLNNGRGHELWGVEDRDLYKKNLEVYRNSLAYKGKIDNALGAIDNVLLRLKAAIYNAGLIEFDTVYARYKKGTIDLREYLIYLVRKAGEKGVGTKDMGNVILLNRIIAEEASIDFKKANAERDELIGLLSKKLPVKKVKTLTANSLRLRSGELGPKDFHEYLMKEAVSVGIESGPAELRKYMDYISLYGSLDRAKMMDELETLEGRLREGLTENEAQKELSGLSKARALLGNIFDYRLTKDDYDRYVKNPSALDVGRFTDYFKAHAGSYGIAWALPESAEIMDAAREKTAMFFKYSFERDDAFIKGLKLPADKNRLAVIITGGFHSDNICRLFRSKGMDHVSIMPAFTSPEGYSNPYFDILAGKPSGFMAQISAAVSGMQAASLWNALGREIDPWRTALTEAGVKAFARMAVTGKGFLIRLEAGSGLPKEGWIVFKVVSGEPRCYFSEEPDADEGGELETYSAADADEILRILNGEKASRPVQAEKSFPSLIGKVTDRTGNVVTKFSINETHKEVVFEYEYGGPEEKRQVAVPKAEGAGEKTDGIDSFIADVLARGNYLSEDEKRMLEKLRGEINGYKIVALKDIEGEHGERIRGAVDPGKKIIYLAQSVLEAPLSYIHEYGEGERSPEGMPETITRHTAMRGAGKDVRNAFRVISPELLKEADAETVIKLIEDKMKENAFLISAARDKASPMTESEKALLRYNLEMVRRGAKGYAESFKRFGFEAALFGMQDRLDLFSNLVFSRGLSGVKSSEAEMKERTKTVFGAYLNRPILEAEPRLIDELKFLFEIYGRVKLTFADASEFRNGDMMIVGYGKTGRIKEVKCSGDMTYEDIISLIALFKRDRKDLREGVRTFMKSMTGYFAGWSAYLENIPDKESLTKETSRDLTDLKEYFGRLEARGLEEFGLDKGEIEAIPLDEKTRRSVEEHLRGVADGNIFGDMAGTFVEYMSDIVEAALLESIYSDFLSMAENWDNDEIRDGMLSKVAGKEGADRLMSWITATKEQYLRLKEEIGNKDKPGYDPDKFQAQTVDLVKRIGAVIRKEIPDYHIDNFNLTDIVDKNKANCVGYATMFCLIASQIGLDVMKTSLKRQNLKDGTTVDCPHAAALAYLPDGADGKKKFMVVDVTWRYYSDPIGEDVKRVVRAYDGISEEFDLPVEASKHGRIDAFRNISDGVRDSYYSWSTSVNEYLTNPELKRRLAERGLRRNPLSEYANYLMGSYYAEQVPVGDSKLNTGPRNAELALSYLRKSVDIKFTPGAFRLLRGVAYHVDHAKGKEVDAMLDEALKAEMPKKEYLELFGAFQRPFGGKAPEDHDNQAKVLEKAHQVFPKDMEIIKWLVQTYYGAYRELFNYTEDDRRRKQEYKEKMIAVLEDSLNVDPDSFEVFTDYYKRMVSISREERDKSIMDRFEKKCREMKADMPFASGPVLALMDYYIKMETAESYRVAERLGKDYIEQVPPEGAGVHRQNVYILLDDLYGDITEEGLSRMPGILQEEERQKKDRLVGTYDDLIDYLTGILAKFPESNATIERLARIRTDRGNWEKAAELWETWKEKTKSADRNLVLMDCCLNLGKWQRVIELGEEYRYEKVDAHNVTVMQYTGMAYEGLGDMARAVWYYERYLALAANGRGSAFINEDIQKRLDVCREKLVGDVFAPEAEEVAKPAAAVKENPIAYSRGIGGYTEELVRGCQNIIIARTSAFQRANQENWGRKAARKFTKVGVDTMFRGYGDIASLKESVLAAVEILSKYPDKDIMIDINYLMESDDDKGFDEMKGFIEGLKIPREMKDRILLQKDVSAKNCGWKMDDFNVDILKVVSFGTIMLNDRRLARYADHRDEFLVKTRRDLIEFIGNCGLVSDFDRIADEYFGADRKMDPDSVKKFMDDLIAGAISLRLTPVNYEEITEYNDSMEQVYRSL
ncbi:MAG: hypothetical protein HQL30_08065 [Candidatus Omnitrophica bacterium]|nr:hypothetical protein [Candidatus Omnitrophota bacterium]